MITISLTGYIRDGLYDGEHFEIQISLFGPINAELI